MKTIFININSFIKEIIIYNLNLLELIHYI
jgi:hypothetical protein